MQTNIYANTFKGCTSLTSITLPESVKSVYDSAFQDCTSLQSINLGKNVTFIGTYAFYGDTQLTYVDRFSDPDPSHTFEMVGNYAFAGTSLTSLNLALRSSTIYTFWGDHCFEDCKSLREVTILSGNYLSKQMFKGCTNLQRITFNNNMMAYTYPGVFEGCVSLTSVTLPSQFLYVPSEMFKDCINLKAVGFSNYEADKSGLALIQRNAFYNTPNLTSIYLPASISELDMFEDASLSNSNVQHLYLHGISQELIGYSKNLPEDIYFGQAYNVTTVDDFKKVLEIRKLTNVPLAVVVEFMFTYCYDASTGATATVYMSKMNPKQNIHSIEYNKGIDHTFDELDCLDLASINYENHSYDLTKKRGIIVRAICNLGHINSKNTSYKKRTPSRLLADYRSNSRAHAKSGDYDYNLLTYLTRNKFIQESYLTTLVNLTFYVGSWYAPYNINTHYKGISRTNSDYNKILYNTLVNRESSFYNRCAAQSQPQPIFVQNIILNDILKTTRIYRANFPTEQIVIHCKDGELACPLAATAEVQYVPPVEYISDRSTVWNFQVGKPYYNAQELYSYARATNTPALFIYSMQGCGPCQIYSRNIWNNAEFQNWLSRQRFFICGMEVETQPYYDTELKFCVDQLSPNARNFAKLDQGQSEDYIPANALGNKFKRFRNANGDLASNLMTPVIVFMDEYGNCWDYTYHSIETLIAKIGVNNTIQRLKSLCLYHFDGNSLANARFVVDAKIPFSKEYFDNLTNEESENSDKYRFISSNTIEIIYSGATPNSVMEDIKKSMRENDQSVGIINNNVYLGGCILYSIGYIYDAFVQIFTDDQLADMEEIESADGLNNIFSQLKIKIGNNIYVLNALRIYQSVPNPCGEGNINIFQTMIMQA